MVLLDKLPIRRFICAGLRSHDYMPSMLVLALYRNRIIAPIRALRVLPIQRHACSRRVVERWWFFRLMVPEPASHQHLAVCSSQIETIRRPSLA